jgi:hypothetical protein
MEVISTIQENLLIVSKDFKKLESKSQNIKIVRVENKVQFQYDLPDYILESAKQQLPDKYKNLKRAVRSESLASLVYIVNEISFELEAKNTFEDKIGEKVIFIKYRGSAKVHRDGYCGAGMGKLVSISFNYFIGYRFLGQKQKFFSNEMETVEIYRSEFQATEYNNLNYKKGEIVPLHHTTQDLNALKREYLIVEWTQDRENFLKALEKAFETQTTRLDEFLKDLDRDKLDHLISEFPVQKLLGPNAEE